MYVSMQSVPSTIHLIYFLGFELPSLMLQLFIRLEQLPQIISIHTYRHTQNAYTQIYKNSHIHTYIHTYRSCWKAVALAETARSRWLSSLRARLCANSTSFNSTPINFLKKKFIMNVCDDICMCVCILIQNVM